MASSHQKKDFKKIRKGNDQLAKLMINNWLNWKHLDKTAGHIESMNPIETSILLNTWTVNYPSQETEVTSTPTRPVDNFVITTKGLQDRNIHILDGTTVKNKVKLILTNRNTLTLQPIEGLDFPTDCWPVSDVGQPIESPSLYRVFRLRLPLRISS